MGKTCREVVHAAGHDIITIVKVCASDFAGGEVESDDVDSACGNVFTNGVGILEIGIHGTCSDSVLCDFVSVQYGEGTRGIECHVVHFDKFSLMLNHEVLVVELRQGDGQRGDILVDGDQRAVGLCGLELQESVVVGQCAVKVFHFVADFKGTESVAGVVNKDGPAGVLQHFLVVIRGYCGDHHFTGELVFHIGRVVDGHVRVIQFGTQFGDVCHLEFGGNTVGERERAGGCHYIAGCVSNIVDRQGVGVAFGEGGGDG